MRSAYCKWAQEAHARQQRVFRYKQAGEHFEQVSAGSCWSFWAEKSVRMAELNSAEAAVSAARDQQVLALLKESARYTLDVLREKPKHSKPPVGQLRRDSTAMVQTLIKLVMSKTDKTVVVICTGWLPDLVLQWRFHTAKITCQAVVRQDGSNVLADHDVLHSEPDRYDHVSSRMMPAACAHRRLKQLAHGHMAFALRMSHRVSPRPVCCARQTRARP